MSRFVRLFKPRFGALVKSGAKLQTVRPVPKRMPKAGDILDARQWSGKPYRSPQIRLGEHTINEVKLCCITKDGIWQQFPDGSPCVAIRPEADRFARADGFKDWPEMLAWFRKEHDLKDDGHFDGIIIYWS